MTSNKWRWIYHKKGFHLGSEFRFCHKHAFVQESKNYKKNNPLETEIENNGSIKVGRDSPTSTS